MTPRKVPRERLPPKPTLEQRVDMLTKRVAALEDQLRQTPIKAVYVDPRPLREARLLAGWSAQDVATGLGLRARMSVYHWEDGTVRLSVWRAREIVDLFVRSDVAPPVFPELEKKP